MCQIKTQPGQKPADVAIAEYNTYRDMHDHHYSAATEGVTLRVQLATFIPPVDAPYATIKAQFEKEQQGETKFAPHPVFEDRRYSITEKQAGCPTMMIALNMVADAIQETLKLNR